MKNQEKNKYRDIIINLYSLAFTLALVYPVLKVMFMSSISYSGYIGAFSAIMMLIYPYTIFMFLLKSSIENREECEKIEKGKFYYLKMSLFICILILTLGLIGIIMYFSYSKMYNSSEILMGNSVFSYGLAVMFIFTVVWSSTDSIKVIKASILLFFIFAGLFIGLSMYETKQYEEKFLKEGLICSEVYNSINLEKGDSIYSLDGSRIVLTDSLYVKKSCLNSSKKLYIYHDDEIYDPDEVYGCGGFHHIKKHPKGNVALERVIVL